MDLFGSCISVFCCRSSPIDVLITPWRRLKPCTPKRCSPKRRDSCPCWVKPSGKWSQGILAPAERGPCVPWDCCGNTFCAGAGEWGCRGTEGSVWGTLCFGWNFALGVVQGHAGADSVNPLWRWWQSNTDIAPEQGKAPLFPAPETELTAPGEENLFWYGRSNETSV